jgi:DoxX-like protein
MESTLHTPAFVAARTAPKAGTIVYWIVTALFCLWMGFTAFAQLKVPPVADAFKALGFPAYFRVELAWAKFFGIAALLFPAPARIKEWAYAGFAIVLVSAFIAHVSMGQGPAQWAWAPVAFVLLALSYIFRLRLQASPASA